MASRGTSRGERVEDPVDAVLTLVTVGRQLFLSKEESCGVEEAAILCNAAGERDQQILTGEGCSVVVLGDDCQPAVAWSSRPLDCVANNGGVLLLPSVMQRARGQTGETGAMLQRRERLHPTLRSRASTCSYSVKGQKSTLLYPAPLSDHHLSRVEG